MLVAICRLHFQRAFHTALRRWQIVENLIRRIKYEIGQRFKSWNNESTCRLLDYGAAEGRRRPTAKIVDQSCLFCHHQLEPVVVQCMARVAGDDTPAHGGERL